MPDERSKNGRRGTVSIAFAVAEVVYDVVAILALEGLSEEDSHHSLALAWGPTDPEQIRIILQPRFVCWIFKNPLAGACHPFTFPVEEALAVDLRVGEKETSPAAFLSGFAMSGADILDGISRSM
jgi:hypothetical protein